MNLRRSGSCRKVFIPQLYNISIDSTSHELTLIDNVSSTPAFEFAHFMKTKLCPNNVGVFHQDVEVKFIVERRLYTKDGIAIEIYDSGFCLEEFYNPQLVDQVL
jgi:hypothetical protein